jgi:lambda repressor-like predicted transcriptional regulator
MIAAKPNIAQIVQAMRTRGWGVRDTCVNCGVNSKTLKKILGGEIPRRIDALYRVADGLGISIKEAVYNASTPKTAERGRVLLFGRRPAQKITSHK